MRPFLDLFRQAKPLRLDDLPIARRPPEYSEELWLDHLFVVAKGYRTEYMLKLMISDPLVEAALQLYHLGPTMFTLPELRRPCAGPLLWTGWQGVAQSPSSTATN